MIGNLDAPRFKVRELAMRRLIWLGGAAERALNRALKDPPSEEARRRIETILPELVRPLRCVPILERLGTREARRLLRRLAVDGSTAATAVAARAALARLTPQRPSQ